MPVCHAIGYLRAVSLLRYLQLAIHRAYSAACGTILSFRNDSEMSRYCNARQDNLGHYE